MGKYAIYNKLVKRIVLFMIVFGSATLLVSGCSQGPISIDEATEIRAEIGAMQDQLADIRSDLASIIEATENQAIETSAEQMRDTVAMMMSSLSRVEEALKPEEPETPPGQAPAGGMGGAPGGGGGFQ